MAVCAPWTSRGAGAVGGHGVLAVGGGGAQVAVAVCAPWTSRGAASVWGHCVLAVGEGSVGQSPSWPPGQPDGPTG